MSVAVRRSSLGELAKIANQEHAEVAAHLRQGLRHAFAAGEALAEAKEALGLSRTRDSEGRYVTEEGVSWSDWVATNLDFHLTTANWYVRIYAYRADLEAAGTDSFKGAMRFLRQSDLRIRETLGSEDVKLIHRLHQDGVPQTEIAKRLDVSKSAINHYIRKRVRRQPTPRWLTHSRRKTGGKWDEAYSLFRRSLDQIQGVAPNADRKYDELYAHLYWIEDFFGKQMRTGR